MRGIIIFVCLVLSYCKSFSADEERKYFTIDNGSIIFEAVYEMPGNSVDSIRRGLLHFIAKESSVLNLKESEGGLTCELSNFIMDSKAMGYKSRATTPFVILNPLFADVTILIKEGKYKVIIKNIISDKRDNSDPGVTLLSNSELEDYLLTSDRSSWGKSKGKVAQSIQIEQELYKVFQFKGSNDNW